MDWTLIVRLIVDYGIPFTSKVFEKWTTGNPPTQADFDELNALANQNQNYKSVLLSRAALKGISTDDPKLRDILNLLK